MTSQAQITILSDANENTQSLNQLLSESFSSKNIEVRALEAIRENGSSDVTIVDGRSKEGNATEEVIETIDPSETGVILITDEEPSNGRLETPVRAFVTTPVDESSLTAAVTEVLAQEAFDQELDRVLDLASRLSLMEGLMSVEEMESSDQYTRREREFLRACEGLVRRDGQKGYYETAMLEKLTAISSLQESPTRNC